MFGQNKRIIEALAALLAAVTTLSDQRQAGNQPKAHEEHLFVLRNRVSDLEGRLATIQAEAEANLLLAQNERKVARRAEERTRTDLNRLAEGTEAGEAGGFDLEEVADAYAEHGLQLEHGGSGEEEGVPPVPTRMAGHSRHANALALKFGA